MKSPAVSGGGCRAGALKEKGTYIYEELLAKKFQAIKKCRSGIPGKMRFVIDVNTFTPKQCMNAPIAKVTLTPFLLTVRLIKKQFNIYST